MDNYISKHWNGNFPLWKSYWINSVLLATITSLLAGFLAGLILGLSFHAATGHMGSVAGAISATPIVVWSIVGTWRSATKYNETHTGFTWGIVDKVMMVIGTFKGVGDMIVILADKTT